MQDNIALIKKRSLSGVVALVSRTFILQIIAFVSTFLLTIFLSPKIYGVYYVVSAVISFFNYFSDIGLAAALIQKTEEITDDDLASTFTIQEVLVIVISILMLVCSPYIIIFYKLDRGGLYLFWALIFSFFISSLKTIPSVMLERKLEFDKLVIPQILETLAFYLICVIMAWKGFGVASFSIAVIARAIVGLIAIYYISPWHIHIGLSTNIVKRLLRFGIPFQVNSMLALLKDDLLTLFLGKVLTLDQIGYIGWAKKWAEVPLRLIMDNVIRVTFPAFSRLQHSKDLLAKAIETTIFGLAITMVPISVLMWFYMPAMVHLIPRYLKWEPALFSFSLFVVGSLLSGFSTPLTNALNAIGKIKITLYLMLSWTVATWILTVVFVYLFNYNGVAIALSLITFSVIIVAKLVQNYVPFSMSSNLKGPVIAALVQSLFYYVSSMTIIDNWTNVIARIMIGVILYLAVLYVVERTKLTKLISDIYVFRKT